MSAQTAVDLECRACGAALHVESHLRTALCPYCASPSVVDRPPQPGRPVPTFALGFQIDKARAQQFVRQWGRSQGPLKRSDLHRAHIEELRGIYSPAFLYSATAHTDYEALIGENYTETETYTEYVDGKMETRTRTVTKTEWRSLTGRQSAYVADVLVTASRGIANAELELLEPYDVRALRRYGPELVSGWIAEDPSISLEHVAQMARQEAVTVAGRRLGAFMPGDSHRVQRYQTTLTEEAIDFVLVPLWVLALRYDPQKPPVRVLVNGQTGKVHGKAPWSAVKITLLVSFILSLIITLALIIVLSGASR